MYMPCYSSRDHLPNNSHHIVASPEFQGCVNNWKVI